MRVLRLFPALLAVLAVVFVAGCSTSRSGFPGYDRTVTSSISPGAPQRTAQRRPSDLVTNDRTGYVSRRVVQEPMF